MKRLITILLSSIVGVSLCGLRAQDKIPMTVVGDVYIDTDGNMQSDGPVHLQALSKQSVAKVANYGNLKMDSALFYTNDSIDGLLMNINDATGDHIPTGQVAVRKTISKSNSWYMMSLPFDLDMSKYVVNSLTGQKLTRGTEFQVQFYNSEKRAKIGLNVDTVWETLPAATTILPKGTAFRIAVLLTKLATDTLGASQGRFGVDFLANPADNTGLFANVTKGVDFTYYECKLYQNPEYSSGWNAFGGLNSTNFNVSTNTTGGFDTLVWYRSNTDPKGAWVPLYTPDKTATGTLRPYAPLFAQTTSKAESVLNQVSGGGFTFLPDGVVLDPVSSTAPIFRSVQAAENDLVKMQFSKADGGYVAPAYFTFNKAYDQYFRFANDKLMINTAPTDAPCIWSVATKADNSDNYSILVKSLPLGESVVQLGVNTPVSGEYIFSLSELVNENASVKTASLRDNDKKIDWDLLKSGDYHFTANASASQNTSRFVLTFNKSMTSIISPITSEIYAYAENNVLIVKNLLTGDKVQVLDMAGRTLAAGVATGDTYSVTLNQKGVYVVNVKGQKILKVLNK
jgi:hypothetical protein